MATEARSRQTPLIALPPWLAEPLSPPRVFCRLRNICPITDFGAGGQPSALRRCGSTIAQFREVVVLPAWYGGDLDELMTVLGDGWATNVTCGRHLGGALDHGAVGERCVDAKRRRGALVQPDRCRD